MKLDCVDSVLKWAERKKERDAANKRARFRAFAEKMTSKFAEHGLAISLYDGRMGRFIIEGGVSDVNWYPLSREKTAFIRGVSKVFNNVDFNRAVRLATASPDEVIKTRRGSYSSQRRFLWTIQRNCFWCYRPLIYEKTTIDHLKPLSKGGSNGIRNLVLAHPKCNNKRGDEIADPADILAAKMMIEAGMQLGRPVSPQEFRNIARGKCKSVTG